MQKVPLLSPLPPRSSPPPLLPSSFAVNFSEVIPFCAWVISNVLATATKLFRFYGSLVFERPLIPKFATSFHVGEREH